MIFGFYPFDSDFLSKLTSFVAVLSLMMFIPLNAGPGGQTTQDTDRSFSELASLSQEAISGHYSQMSNYEAAQPLDGDCLFGAGWGTTAAPDSGETVNSGECNFTGEYHTLTGAEDGVSYTVSSTQDDYLTIRTGTSGGVVIAQGYSPVEFTGTGENLYIHISIDEFCNGGGLCRSLDITRPTSSTGGCVNFWGWGSTDAPEAGESVTSGSCNWADEYHRLLDAEAGVEYIISSSENDWLTVRAGVYTGPVIAEGWSPLTVVATGDYELFVHINTDEFCGEESSCRYLTFEREGAAGEYCDWRIRVWGNNGLGVEWTLTDGNGTVVDSSPDGGWATNSISYLSGTYNLVEPVTFTLNANTSGDYQSVNYYLLRNGAKIEHGRARDAVIEHMKYCSDDIGAIKPGMNASLSGFDFTYHPNPVEDVLHINSVQDVKEVKVYNIAGQQMLNFDKGLSVKNELDVTKLPSGVYVFRAVLENGQVETFKVVKR